MICAAKPFFDLNIHETCVADSKSYDRVIRRLYEFGYRTIAINQIYDDTQQAAESKSKKNKKTKGKDAGEPFLPKPFEIKKVIGCEDLKILNRLTIVYDRTDNLYKIANSPYYKDYDIIAVCPTSYAALQFTCTNIDADILAYDPTEKSSFKLNRKQYNTLINKSYHFELVYAPCISDNTQRKNMIHRAHGYHSIGKSRNIIVSSAATNYMLLRGPYDVVNVGLIFGLSQEQSKLSISTNSNNVYLNAYGRRHGKAIMFMENIGITTATTNGKEIKESEEDSTMEIDDSVPSAKRIKCDTDE